jgi:hypothetical protein
MEITSTPPAAENLLSATEPDESPQRSSRRLPLAGLFLGLVAYALVTLPVAIAQREQINPDAVSYIRNAMYLRDGKWFESVSGYWSPLLSWTLTPFISFGWDALYASRLVLGLWGAALIISVFVFLRRCTNFPYYCHMAILGLVGLATGQWTTRVISPDVLLGALLIFYFAFVARSSVLSKPMEQIVAGMVGGAAYLAKSYAFPFFLLHYPASLFLHVLLNRPSNAASKLFRALLCGFCAFAVVAGPWIGVLSYKYKKFTFSTVTPFVHYLVGPPEIVGDDRYQVLHQVQSVPHGRISVWETPENLAIPRWSPFTSIGFFKHQLKHMVWNCETIVGAIAQFDLFGIVPGALFLMIPIRIAAAERGRGRFEEVYPAVWCLATIVIYTSGFLPIYFESRYIEAVLWPLCCIVTFAVALDASRIVGRATIAVIMQGLLLSVCVLSFAGYSKGIVNRAMAGNNEAVGALGFVKGGYVVYRECGRRVRGSGVSGPVAACEGCWHEGLYVAYHASLPFLGEVRESSVAKVEGALERWGARVFVARRKWPLYGAFEGQSKWRRLTPGEGDRDDGLVVFLAP